MRKTALRRVGRDLLLNQLIASPLLVDALRGTALRACGVQVAPSARVRAWCFFGGTDVMIGEGAIVNIGCFFDNAASIEVGKGCGLGMEVMLCTSEHQIGDERRRFGDLEASSIRIEDGSWIGARALIMPGVTVGKGCIVAAGAVVTENCEPQGLYAGVPAKRIRSLPVA